jgi:hypothetical protein
MIGARHLSAQHSRNRLIAQRNQALRLISPL